MKRILSMLLCVILVSGLVVFPASAEGTTDDQIIISQSINYISDDSYYIETISVPSIQTYGNAKTGTKSAVFVSSGTAIFTISVTGTFSYDGSSSKATSASGSIATHVPNATISSRNAYTSGASAIATGSVVYYGITLQKTVTLTCDKNGNLS